MENSANSLPFNMEGNRASNENEADAKQGIFDSTQSETVVDFADDEPVSAPTAASLSSLHIRFDSLLSDANTKATDAAANIKSKLRSLSPAKRRSDSDAKDKRKGHRGKRISQIMSGASFKSKCALFKRIFKDLPLEEMLIVDYSCALQRDILVHGRVYLSQNWMCFYANIFGWETLETINWHEITAITKEKTARVIPNAIRISTSRDRYFFTSFVSRDNSYTALFRVWQNALLGQAVGPLELRKLCRRFRKRTSDDVDGVVDDKDETGDEVTENDNDNPSISPSDVSQDYQGDQGQKTKISVIPPTPPVGVHEDDLWTGDLETSDVNKSGLPDPKEDNDGEVSDVSSRSPSPILRRAENLLAFAKQRKKQRKKLKKTFSLLPAPETSGLEGSENENTSEDNAETDDAGGEVFCPCVGAHPGVEYCVEEFDFDVDALFEHCFSSDSDVMKQIHESRKMLNVRYHDFTKNEDGSSERLLTYTLTLNYTIGPKHSETSVKQIFHKNNTPGSFYVVETEVYNKGIPYADSFHIFSLYCLTRLPGNRCKMRIHSEVRYTKSMMGIAKSMIQRNADQAFNDYFKNLALVLRQKSQAKPSELKKKRKRQATGKATREETFYGKSEVGKATPTKKIEYDGDQDVQTTFKAANVSVSSNSPLPGGQSPRIIVGVSTLLILLLLVNSYLLHRVYQLEKFAAYERKHNCVPKNLPVTDENWYKLLQTQRHAHELEVKRLKDVIGGTVVLIKQVETSMKDLYEELDRNFQEELKPNST
ncbi:protein Aster-C-like isoform X2 [Rhopilema esculentum]|uniref:protein Aster-C-like isoform X2 n=1 Tax=Rhopilema esculentum TaxID=499914 RepID=UPI0031D234CB